MLSASQAPFPAARLDADRAGARLLSRGTDPDRWGARLLSPGTDADRWGARLIFPFLPRTAGGGEAKVGFHVAERTTIPAFGPGLDARLRGFAAAAAGRSFDAGASTPHDGRDASKRSSAEPRRAERASGWCGPQRSTSGARLPGGTRPGFRKDQELNEKIVILATYLGTVDLLGREIGRSYPGQGVVVLRGGDHGAKLAAARRFRKADGPRGLACTAADRKGINLQIARVLFNFDVP